MKREEIFQYVKEQYGTEPEYLWKKDPDSAVLRHKNGKWYAIIMVVEKKILGLEEDGNIDILGPSDEKITISPPSYPYIVVKTEYRKEPVIFERFTEKSENDAI